MTTPNNAAALERLEAIIAEMHGTAFAWNGSSGYDDVMYRYAVALEKELATLRATLAQPDATRPRAIWPDALSSPERQQLRVLLECVDRRVLSLHEADQLVNLIADALTSQPSGEAMGRDALRLADELDEYAESYGSTHLLVEDAKAAAATLRAIYTHPSADAPGVAVDEGRVDVALVAYSRADYQWCQRDPDDRDEPRHRFAMRAALTAALAPKPEGGHG